MKNTLLRFFFLFTALAVLSACSGSTDLAREEPEATPSAIQGSILPPAADADPGFDDPEAQDSPTSPDGTNTEGLEIEEQQSSPEGRLVVQDSQDQLLTLLPDGTDEVFLTEDPDFKNSLPTWAPDGSRIAWVSESRLDGSVQLISDRFDNSDRHSIELEQAPVYLSWNVSGSKLAFLKPARQSGALTQKAGLDLWVWEPLNEQGPQLQRIDRGQPFSFAWSPDSDEMVVSASGFRLDRIDLKDTTFILNDKPGSFGTPFWLENGDIYFADQSETSQFLASAGRFGEGRRPLTSFSDEYALRFVISRSGNWIMMTLTESVAQEADEEIITASYQNLPTQFDFSAQPAQNALPQIDLEAALGNHHPLVAQQDPNDDLSQEPTVEPTPEYDDTLDQIDPIEPGHVYMMGTFGGEPYPLIHLNQAKLISFHISPDGQNTAIILQEAIHDGYLVYIDSSGESSGPFFIQPSDEFLERYSPSFDQFAHSMNAWSFSGKYFAIAGFLVNQNDTESMVYLFNTETQSLEKLRPGVFASFTHSDQVGGAASIF